MLVSAAYFYNVYAACAVHGADPTAVATVQSAPWTALVPFSIFEWSVWGFF